jgi:hypothetical protein
VTKHSTHETVFWIILAIVGGAAIVLALLVADGPTAIVVVIAGATGLIVGTYKGVRAARAVARSNDAVVPRALKVMGPVTTAFGMVMVLSDLDAPRNVLGATLASALVVVGFIQTMTAYRLTHRNQTVAPHQ